LADRSLALALEAGADVAVAAAAERFPLVAEVAQDEVVAAAARLDVAHQVEEELPLPLARRLVELARVVDEAAAKREVARAGEEQPVRGGAVAAGAADLLVILFDAARGLGVGHQADVRAIDAHAEGVGGDHQPASAGREAGAGPLAHRGLEARVVGGAAPALLGEQRRDLLRVLARAGVDDGGALALARPAERLAEPPAHQAHAAGVPVELL